MGILEVVKNLLLGFYNSIVSILPPALIPAFSLLITAIIIALISIFIWKFYRNLSKRNLITLNLTKYNRSEHPSLSKLYAIALYLVEYIIIIPALVLIWFAGLTIIILLIAEGKEVQQIILLSAATVAAIRILAYYEEDLSRDLAKLFPFITLSTFILSAESINLQSILNNLPSINTLLSNVIYFLVAIVAIEIFLRIIYMLVQYTISILHPGKEEISQDAIKEEKGIKEK
tara:strand:+ start:1966 stop:2658 length:693 start_codon:yes stop_codon:yes gene_type:complete